MNYNFNKIEAKWIHRWELEKTYQVSEDNNKKKFYVLDMFPYPSGAGLHVGHPLGYIASDIYARYMRLKGFNVLHPMGYDSFGLPAEQYAIETGQHPEITTKNNIDRYREQLNKIGFSFDWDREIQTSNPSYYKWTQWIFKKLFESYYCNTDNKAKCISKLKISFEKNGNLKTNANCDKDTPRFNATEWNSWSLEKKEKILLKYRLAFLSDTWVNWCEGLGTVLANDEIKDGFSERGNFPVKQKKMRQWSLRIIAYADRLLEGLDSLDWSESIKETQRNWIGRSQGALINFETENNNCSIPIFTTRPDTIYGVSFIVIAPEHELINKVTINSQKSIVHEYCKKAALNSERDRQSNMKNISGVFSGSYAIHPFTKKPIPIWIADYVLSSYGTGAIMAVPCGDQRDWSFAKKFNLKIPNIFEDIDITQHAYEDKHGVIKNSNFLNNLTIPDAIKKAVSVIKKKKIGLSKINYRLRNAIFSRQRYWGEPFPVYYKNEIPYLIEDVDCVELPIVDKYLPTEKGEPPLARAKKKDWNIYKGDRMEYNTMPGWAGSSWYFLRFMDPKNNREFVAKTKVDYWKQVDLYVGGAEHAVGHLLYSRFWTKFLYDKDLISFDEPFKKLINQGMILGRSSFVYRIENTNTFVSFDKKDDYKTSQLHVDIEFVDNDILNIKQFKNWRLEFKDAKFILNDNNQYLCGFEIEKMSKSKYNTQNPDHLIEKFGADTLRMYEMFLGPIEQFKPWNTKSINGVHTFLKKLWNLTHDINNDFIISEISPTEEEYRSLHRCIKKVTADLERFSFNTGVSALMICLNELIKLKCYKREIISNFVILLSPYAPYISEEIWESLGNSKSINSACWPVFEKKYLTESNFTYPISFNGKLKFTLELKANLSTNEIEKNILSNKKMISFLNERTIKRIIIIPHKIINIVV